MDKDQSKIATRIIEEFLQDLNSINNVVTKSIDKSFNSDPKTKILCELWTSLDDSIKHLGYSLQSLRSLD